MVHPWPLIGFIVLVFMLSAGSAALLRQAGMNRHGARSIGGLLVGLLLGPNILGAMNPQKYREHILGGAQEQRALEQIAHRHGADLTAAQYARVDFDQLQTLRQQHARDSSDARRRLQRAEMEHQRCLRWAIIVLIAVLLASAGRFSIVPDGQPTHLAHPLSVGLWAAGVPGGLAFAAAHWWWNHEAATAAVFAAGVAIGPWALTRQEADVADEVEIGGARLIQNAGRIASMLAITVALCAIAIPRQNMLWWYAGVLLALPAGWLLFGRILAPPHQRTQGGAGPIFDSWIMPGLAALVSVRIDFINGFSIWPLILIAVLSSDGRWLGAVAGAMLPGGRKLLRTMRLVIPAMAAGPTQLCMAGVASICGAISDSLLLALVAGAALVDLTADTRRRLASQLAETEEELS